MLFSWVIGKIFIFGSLFVILFQLSIVLQFTIVQTALGVNYALAPIAPKLVTRSQSPHVTKILEFSFYAVLNINCWTKWGIFYENWTVGCWAMSNILFWAQLGQNIVLGPRPPVNLNFPNHLV